MGTIKSNELRIGNILYFGDPKDTIKPCYFNIEGGYSIDAVADGVDVRGIPITEDWLMKLGFKENVIGVFTMGFLDLERLLLDSPEWEICINEEQTGYTIRYVHQLQNLYFALTGEELPYINALSTTQ